MDDPLPMTILALQFVILPIHFEGTFLEYKFFELNLLSPPIIKVEKYTAFLKFLNFSAYISRHYIN